MKECLKKVGPVTGHKLEKVMFDLNSMSRSDKSGSPLDLFLGRSVNTMLPNAGNKVVNMRREVEKRKEQQGRWMRRLGRVSRTDFKVGDKVRVQDVRSGEWGLKGEVAEVISHDGGSLTYRIEGEEGGSYLRNGRFVKLRLSKAKAICHVTFESPVSSCAGG